MGVLWFQTELELEIRSKLCVAEAPTGQIFQKICKSQNRCFTVLSIFNIHIHKWFIFWEGSIFLQISWINSWQQGSGYGMVIWDVMVPDYGEVNLHLGGNCSRACLCYSALLFSVSTFCLPLPLSFGTLYLKLLPVKSVFPIKVISVMQRFCQIALQLLQYLFHAQIGVLSTIKPLGAIFSLSFCTLQYCWLPC